MKAPVKSPGKAPVKVIHTNTPNRHNLTKTRELAEVAVISALYVALTYLVAPVAYGPIQFRVSEALVILVAARRHLLWFVPVGCVVANLLSPYAGVWDLAFMPAMSTVGALPLFFMGRRFVLADGLVLRVGDGALGGADDLGHRGGRVCGPCRLGHGKPADHHDDRVAPALRLPAGV